MRKADSVCRLLPLGSAFRAQFLILGETKAKDSDMGWRGGTIRYAVSLHPLFY